MMLVHVAVAVCFLALGSADQKNYHFIHVEEDARVHQDIYHDSDANTVTVTVGDVSMYTDHISTVSYHDFDTKYGVFKDIRRKLCLLTPTPVPEATPDIYALGETNWTLPYDGKIIEDILTTADVETIAGPRISSFCNDYVTHHLQLTPTRMRSQRDSQANFNHVLNCGGCLISLDDYPRLIV